MQSNTLPGRQIAVAKGRCQDCHPRQHVTGHPLGAVARPAVLLPLGPGRTVECGSCHEVDDAHPHFGPAPRLRLPARQLCAACHPEGGPESAQVMHARIAARAHGGPDAGGSAAHELDAGTRSCLACHDGFAARSVLGAADWVASGHPAGHALDLPYATARRRADRRLRPESALPAPVHLVDGKIGCATCHSFYTPHAGMLALSMQGSRLCRACHDM